MAGKAVREALKALGLTTMCAREADADNAVSAVFLPQGLGDYGFRRHLYETYGVILGDANMLSWETYRNQIGRQYVRIGAMGESAKYQRVLYALFGFTMALRDLGAEADPMAATEAVKKVYKR